MHRYRESGILAALTVVALTLRLGYCAFSTELRPRPPGNHREYIVAAQRLLTDGVLLSPLIIDQARATPSTHLPPLYVFLVAALYKVLGTETAAATTVLQLINAAATALVVPVIFACAREITTRRAAWMAAGLVTVNPMLVGFADYIWDTNLFIFAAALSVWATLRMSQGPQRWWRWWLFGLWLGGVALLNPALSVTYPLLVLWALTRNRRWHTAAVARDVAAVVLGWLMAITPWTVRNYVQLDELIYIRGGVGMELWLGVCPEADGQGDVVLRRRLPLLNDAEQERIARIGEQAYFADCSSRAWGSIRADPWRYARLAGIRVVDYWAGTNFTHNPTSRWGWPRRLPRVGIMILCAAEVLLVVGGFLARRKIGADARWLLAIVVVFSLSYIATHAQVRYRAPTEPMIAILAAAALCGGRRSEPPSARPFGRDDESAP
jgi:4-amino-4-deoxy-L-arabinose transferase-like glycosyltransferase